LACADAGLILKHLRYDTWSRHGASGTAMAAVHCYPGSDQVPVRFTFGPARLLHALLAMRGPDLVYDRKPCN
jgi:hypothetical protein